VIASIWLPALIVLALGLAIGTWTAARLRSSNGSSGDVRSGDRRLTIVDLERRRNELYDRLRSEETLTPAGRRSLEEEAAGILAELDRLAAEEPHRRRSRPGQRQAATSSRQGTKNPLLASFLLGGALVGLLGLLVDWGLADATGTTGIRSTSAPSGEPPRLIAPNPDDQALLASFEARLAAEPSDLAARKEYAVLLLASGQTYEALVEADTILSASPDDPDALYIRGVGRLAMGQPQQALDALSRVLDQHPRHLAALFYQGYALLHVGLRDQAVDSWEKGLDLAGGSDSRFEQALAEVR